ncbi:MAG TPA: pentapeptide repeat-containing protein, partial [Puia sp.]|nr:pentapeptide repeat-containing protein [Puia sp.]
YDAQAKMRPLKFEDCNLEGSVIDNCNLSGVELKNCNIKGLKIDGMDVSALLDEYRKNAQK